MPTLYNIREQASAALFALMSGVTNFTSTKRKFENWEQVGSAGRPALRWLENGESRARSPAMQPGQLGTILMVVHVLIYWDADISEGATPATKMNELLASVDLVMQPNVMTGRNDLGLAPMVQDAWIEGEIIKDPGDSDGVGLLAIPVNVLLLP